MHPRMTELAVYAPRERSDCFDLTYDLIDQRADDSCDNLFETHDKDLQWHPNQSAAAEQKEKTMVGKPHRTLTLYQ
jgi:hypothetical protein